MNIISIQFHCSRNNVLFCVTLRDIDNNNLLFITEASFAMSPNLLISLSNCCSEVTRTALSLLFNKKFLDLGVIMQHMTQRLTVLGGRILSKMFIIKFNRFMIPNFENHSLVSPRWIRYSCLSYLRMRWGTDECLRYL